MIFMQSATSTVREFVPPHLSLVLIYSAHDLVLIFWIAKSINQLGQWKPQGHLHYRSWPTTMAQTNLMWKHWFYGWSCKSIIWHWKSWRSGSVLHIVTRISYVVLLSNLYVHACPQISTISHSMDSRIQTWSCRLDWIGVHIDHARFLYLTDLLDQECSSFLSFFSFEPHVCIKKLLKTPFS
jgi:hypothetical protein